MVTPQVPLLSATQRRDFDERGVFLTDVLFSPEELDPVRRECKRVYDAKIAREPGHLAQRVRPFLPSVHTESDVVANFLKHPIFVQLARELIGDEVDQAWNQACLKMPDADSHTLFPFHQDSAFAELVAMERAFSCFIALGPLDLDNGTLRFAAGGHLAPLEHHWNERASWWECDVAPFEIVAATLPPGAMAIYQRMTPHGSAPNLTDEPREAMLVAFAPPDVRLRETGERFGDQRPLLREGRLVGA